MQILAFYPGSLEKLPHPIGNGRLMAYQKRVLVIATVEKPLYMLPDCRMNRYYPVTVEMAFIVVVQLTVSMSALDTFRISPRRVPVYR